MKKFRLALAGILFSCAVLQQVGCSDPSEPVDTFAGQIDLDLTIVLDLSDRISKKKHPYRASKDAAIIQECLDFFVEEVRRKLFIGSNDKIQVVLAPQSSNPDVYSWIDSLRIDMSTLSPYERRIQLPALQESFLAALDTLYTKASAADQFVGSDIQRFFAEDLQAEADSISGHNVRTIVVILGDGYHINEDNLRRQGSRYTYNNAQNMKPYRNRQDWEQLFDERDFGFISVQQNLEHVEVLLMGVDPSPVALNEYAIINKIWSKWFTEMGIQRFEIHKTNESTKAERETVRRFLAGH